MSPNHWHLHKLNHLHSLHPETWSRHGSTTLQSPTKSQAWRRHSTVFSRRADPSRKDVPNPRPTPGGLQTLPSSRRRKRGGHSEEPCEEEAVDVRLQTQQGESSRSCTNFCGRPSCTNFQSSPSCTDLHNSQSCTHPDNNHSCTQT
jgi:hypothetical protein